jgi:hypothetical protein
MAQQSAEVMQTMFCNCPAERWPARVGLLATVHPPPLRVSIRG